MHFIKPLLFALITSTCVARAAFQLPTLPYSFDALEPYIDELTMRIHYERHHGAQVNGLNAAIQRFPELANLSIEEVMRSVSQFDASVRNNGGGHFNHSIFWNTMAPAGTGGEPSPELLEAITAAFGSMDALRRSFTAAANGQFGSGWAWLIVDDSGQLVITSTPNQDNPLMDVAAVRGTPILALDVWEHAYYLSYQNRRPTYVHLWWNVVNWNAVSNLYASAVAAR